ncbi:MAG: hypothetical protein MJE66_08335, partial [Proteobacteria bacterium]|nr:hypothetical protein [Pseudomonadota bacterium]
DAVIVRPLVAVSDAVLYRSIDAAAIDSTGVDGAGRAVRAIAGDVLRYAQTGLTQGYLLLMVLGTVALVGYLVR